MSGGILAGIDAMIQEVMPSMAPTAQKAAQPPAKTGPTLLASIFIWGVMLFVAGVCVTVAVILIRRRRPLLPGRASSNQRPGPETVVRRRGFGSGATVSFSGGQASRSSLGGSGALAPRWA